MKEFPLVSVLMTAYNREEYIAQAIESVLSSDYKNIELIIVDDYSSDNTVAIAKRYARNQSVKIFENSKNLGDYANRNKAASFAQGEYLMHVDSDDVIYSDAISLSVSAMQDFPEADFAMCYRREGGECFYLNPLDSIHKHFFQEPILNIGPGGTIIKKKFFIQMGGFPVLYGPANDMYFNLKAAGMAGVLMLPFKVIFYRRHEGQEINKTFEYLYQNYNYLKDALINLPLHLSEDKIAWLQNKNKRRFLVNITKYFMQSFNVNGTRFLLRKTAFSFRDCFAAIFHSNNLKLGC